MLSLRLFLATLLVSACAHAEIEGIFRGGDLQEVSLVQSLEKVQPGSIVIIGENHGFQKHRDQQVQILEALRSLGLPVSVGLEFFTYTDQSKVNDYRAGLLSEADFLTAIAWGGISYDYYRSQALFPDLTQGSKTIALNAPRSLTGKVAKGGLDALTNEEKALLPPAFTVGRDSYKRRFLSMMPHLPTPEAGERYFLSQSIWDDTMAWQAEQFLKTHPQQVLVIVVGDFHVQFGGGLPDRLRHRLPQTPILTFSQVNTTGMTLEELDLEIQPSPTEGPRADYLWLAPVQRLGL